MINETAQQVLLESRQEVYSVALILFWAFMMVIHPAVTWIFKSKKTNWGKYWVAWFIVLLLSGIILGFFIMYPDRLLEFINSINEFIK